MGGRHLSVGPDVDRNEKNDRRKPPDRRIYPGGQTARKGEGSERDVRRAREIQFLQTFKFNLRPQPFETRADAARRAQPHAAGAVCVGRGQSGDGRTFKTRYIRFAAFELFYNYSRSVNVKRKLFKNLTMKRNVRIKMFSMKLDCQTDSILLRCVSRDPFPDLLILELHPAIGMCQIIDTENERCKEVRYFRQF